MVPVSKTTESSHVKGWLNQNEADTSAPFNMDCLRQSFFAWQGKQKELRLPHSHEEAARRIGVEPSAFRQMLRRSSPPPRGVLAKLCDLLGIQYQTAQQITQMAAEYVLEQQETAARLKHAFAIWQRERRLSGKPWTQTYVAAELGLPKRHLGMYFNGKASLGTHELKQFCILMDINPAECCEDRGKIRDQLACESGAQERLRRYLHGEVPLDLSTVDAIGEILKVNSGELLEMPDHVIVPCYELVEGHHLQDQKLADVLVKEKRFFLTRGVKTQDTIALRIDDSSSCDYLMPEDIAFFDLRRDTPDSDGVYLIELDGRAAVRTLERRTNGNWLVQKPSRDKSQDGKAHAVAANARGLVVRGKLFYREGGPRQGIPPVK